MQKENSGKQSFLQGAFVLIAANAIVKVIGAIFKIPLTNMIGEDGMGLFNVAYNFYTFMFVLSTAGLPVAVSKMVSEANALGRPREVKRIVRMAFLAFAAIGFLGSLILFLFAEPLIALTGASPDAAIAVRAIAPAIFCVAISSTFRGYYQGMSNMVPTAISQVIESIFKLVVGYGLACLALANGLGLGWAAAGAISGVTIGTAVSAIYLLLRKRRFPRVHRGVNDQSRSGRKICQKLIRITVPVTIGASVMSLTNLIDMFVVMNRLQDIPILNGVDMMRDAALAKDTATSIYGVYNMSLTLFNLPQTLITALSISIIPAVAAAFAKHNYEKGAKTIESATRITVIMALPCAAGLAVLAEPILSLLYYKRPSAVIQATPLLQLLGLAVLFVAMVSLTNSILQAVGRADIPVMSMFAGGIVKLATNYILVGMPEVNIHGAPIGTTLCYATITVLNLFFIARETDCLPSFSRTVLRPATATAGMAACAYIIHHTLVSLTGNTVAVIAAIGAAAIVYILLLFGVQAVTKDDMLMMPKGEKLVKLLKMK